MCGVCWVRVRHGDTQVNAYMKVNLADKTQNKCTRSVVRDKADESETPSVTGNRNQGLWIKLPML